jgi:hypothetical protein
VVAGSGEGGDGVGAQAVDAAGVDDGVGAAHQQVAGVVEGEAGLALEDEVEAVALASRVRTMRAPRPPAGEVVVPRWSEPPRPATAAPRPPPRRPPIAQPVVRENESEKKSSPIAWIWVALAGAAFALWVAVG